MSRIDYFDSEGTLRKLVLDGLEKYGERPDDVEKIVIGSPDEYKRDAVETQEAELADLDAYEGDTGYGGEELPDVYVWTAERVYFKTVYDGAEGVKSVPRSPTLEDPDLSRTSAGEDS